MRSLLHVASLMMLPVAFIGCVSVSYALVAGYMLASGMVSPGQPMYLDELAPEPKEAAFQFLLGSAFIALSLIARTAIRRKLAAGAV